MILAPAASASAASPATSAPDLGAFLQHDRRGTAPAASAAAASPAAPAPITRTSAWRLCTSRGSWSASFGALPRPAFERMNGSTVLHAHRGRWKTL